MSWWSLMWRRTTSRLPVYPHSFTGVDISKRSAPRHCALQVSSVCPTFSRTMLGRSAVLLVSPGWAPTAYSCISTLRCRATVTAVSSERLCVYHTRCLNLRNSHNRVLISLLSLMCRRTTSRLFVHPHSFTRVDTSKRSSPRHCALQVCSVARNFTHQASIHVI